MAWHEAKVKSDGEIHAIQRSTVEDCVDWLNWVKIEHDITDAWLDGRKIL